MPSYPAILIGLALLLPGQSAAQGATVIGDSDCSQWPNDPGALKASWLLGYLSGMNMVWSGEGKAPGNPLGQFSSAAQAYQWMDGFCKLNPGKKVSDGANALFFEMASRKR
jgi:hypothetical protein